MSTSRRDLRNSYPAHSGQWRPSNMTPPEDIKPSLWGVLAGIICWGTIIAAGVGIVLALMRWTAGHV